MITKSQIIVHILVVFFGIGSWLAINGSFIELPLLVGQLPEGWALASYIAIVTQIGNVGPLLITLFNRFSNRKLSDSSVVYGIYVIGAIACLFLTFFWDHVIVVAGVKRSVPFFILVFFQAFVDCTSSVVFLPFMATLKPQYVTTLFVGQGLSGVLPAIVGIIQGVGQMSCVNVTTTNLTLSNTTKLQPVYAEPLFGVSSYYVFLTILTVLCGTAFFLIDKLPLCRTEYVPEIKKNDDEQATSPLKHQSTEGTMLCDEKKNEGNEGSTRERNFGSTEEIDKKSTSDLEHESNTDDGVDKDLDAAESLTKSSTSHDIKSITGTVMMCLVIFFVLNALTNGILVSVQPYATIPYSLNIYHLITILFKIVPVFATALAYIRAIKYLSILASLVFIGCGGSLYIVAAAVYSPTPWLAGETSGAVIMAFCWILTSALFSYVTVCVANVIRTYGRNALFWCGVAKQAGSAVGSIVMFLLVNLTGIFVSAPKCSP